MRSYLVALFVFSSTLVSAQATAPAPKGGEAALSLVYYRIDFTDKQLDYLRTHEAELIFSVDEKGSARLEKVNYINDPSIVDSLKKVDDRLPEFFPGVSNGIPVSGVYFLKLTWPNLDRPVHRWSPFQPAFPYSMAPYFQPGPAHGRKLNEFESYESVLRYDVTLGVLGYGLTGNASTNKENGAGMKVDFMFFSKKGWGGGMGMLAYGHRNFQPGSLPPTSLRAPRSTVMISANVGRLVERKRADLIVRFEPAWVMQDPVIRDQGPANPYDLVVVRGFSPGVTANVAVPLGPGRVNHFYYFPTAMRSYLNIHVGIRPLFMNVSEASGVLWEAGLSYRLMLTSMSEYTLK